MGALAEKYERLVKWLQERGKILVCLDPSLDLSTPDVSAETPAPPRVYAPSPNVTAWA